MPPYYDVPSKSQWKNDLGLNSIFAKTPFPAMERLISIIESYHVHSAAYRNLRSTEASIQRMQLIHLMHRQCEYIKKNNNKATQGKAYAKDYAKAKMGGQLDTKQMAAVNALDLYLAACLMAFLECGPGGLDMALTTAFGRTPSEKCMEEDVKFRKDSMMDWYSDDVARQFFKLSFRGGLACRWDYEGQGKGNLRLYDTDAYEDEDFVRAEFGGCLFAMDSRARIYCSARTTTNLKHTSFMAGASTLCAGTMRIKQGQIVWISGKSGHYKPTVQQMITLLERLVAYQVKLDMVTVYRENKSQNWKNLYPDSPDNDFEPCPALELLRRRAWPTGIEPFSMNVRRELPL